MMLIKLSKAGTELMLSFTVTRLISERTNDTTEVMRRNTLFVIWKYWRTSKGNSFYPIILLKFSMNLSRNTIGTLKSLTSHCQPVTTGTAEPSEERKRYWLRIIQFSFALSCKIKRNVNGRRNVKSEENSLKKV